MHIALWVRLLCNVYVPRIPAVPSAKGCKTLGSGVGFTWVTYSDFLLDFLGRTHAMHMFMVVIFAWCS